MSLSSCRSRGVCGRGGAPGACRGRSRRCRLRTRGCRGRVVAADDKEVQQSEAACSVIHSRFSGIDDIIKQQLRRDAASSTVLQLKRVCAGRDGRVSIEEAVVGILVDRGCMIHGLAGKLTVDIVRYICAAPDSFDAIDINSRTCRILRYASF